MAFVDLGAEKLFAAEKEGKRISVEVKSFLSPSPVKDLKQALGLIHHVFTNFGATES